jgi:hypothetical protein
MPNLTESSLTEIENRLKAIEQRNARVTADKAWETSAVRRLSIAALTYGVVVTYLIIIHNANPPVNAIVPVMGYLLSTLVLEKVKSVWTAALLRKAKLKRL